MFEAQPIQRRPVHIAYLLGTTALALTACGGSGSGGDSNPGAGNPAFFETEEFLTSEALQQINAAEGYARIPGTVGGDGVRVAVLDDGVDVNHVDLDDNIVADLIISDRVEIDNEEDEALGPNGHGTAVAGVIAAEKNGIGSHGVAFDADIVSLDVFAVPEDTTNTVADIFLSIETGILEAAGFGNPAAEADIINMSLGLTGDQIAANPELVDAVLRVGDAMDAAAGEGKIIVISAGNSAENDPEFPGAFVTRDPVAGLGIVVGSLDADGSFSNFSNFCGSAAEFCLFAPGRDVDSTLINDGFGEVSGTSFSAPLVAGSAAVVKAAFPGVNNREVVNRLLTTAEDLGAPGTDAIFGRGGLDLEAALAPVGELSLSLSGSINGEEAAFASSRISLDSSLALGGDAEALLEKAITLDEQNFPFAVDLRQSLDRRSRTTGLDGFITADRNLTSVQTNEYGSVALSFNEDQGTDDPYRAEFEESDVSLREETDDPRVRFQSEASERLDLFMSLNETSTTDLSIGRALAKEQGAFFQQSAFLAPFDRLAGLQSGGGAIYELSEKTKVSVAAFAAADDEALTQVNLQKVEFLHQTVGDVELRLGYGLLQEKGGFLNSPTSGAFGSQTTTDTQFVSASLMVPVTKDVSLFGAYSRGQSSTSSAAASLLDDFSTTKAEAFGAGFVISDLVDDGDGFSFMVGQPLRATSGSANITVPIGRTEDGSVLTETTRVDLAPDAREITTEAVYSFGLDDDRQDLSTGAFVRFNPDHDPDASPDVGFGIKYRLRF